MVVKRIVQVTDSFPVGMLGVHFTPSLSSHNNKVLKEVIPVSIEHMSTNITDDCKHQIDRNVKRLEC